MTFCVFLFKRNVLDEIECLVEEKKKKKAMTL